MSLLRFFLFLTRILYLRLIWLFVHSAGSLYLFLPRVASLPSRGPYRSGPGASVPAGAPADSPRRSFSSSRNRWRARRSAGSNKWSDYPITSSFTSDRQQNMARRETNRYHLANAVSDIGDVDAQRWASSCSPSEPKNKNLPSGLGFKPLVQLYLEDRIPSVWSLFPSCAPSLRPCSPSVLTALSGRRGRGPTGSLGARVTSGGSSSDCSCLHPSRQTQGRTPDLD